MLANVELQGYWSSMLLFELLSTSRSGQVDNVLLQSLKRSPALELYFALLQEEKLS